MSKSMIVISDVHGCYETLMKLIEQFPKDVPICFAGDLVDRGNMSRDVVKFVKDGGYDCVRGNHEQMMVDYAFDTEKPEYKNLWSDFAQNGGLRTLQSYEGNNDFLEHANWMKKLPTFIEYKDIIDNNGRKLVLSHSSIGVVWNFAVKDGDIFNSAVLWGREPPIESSDIYNIFGHTPQPHGPKIQTFYANIDTGCVFKDRPQYARLTALQFPEMKVFTQENIDE